MAWPLTPHTTFVAYTTKVTAAFLNTLQTTVNDLFNGLISLKAIVIDGTGGAAVTGRAGTMKVSKTDSGVDAGLPLTTVALGEFGRGLVPIGWAIVDGAAGTLDRGINVSNTTRTGLGTYTVVFNVSPTNLTTGCPIVQLRNATGFVTANTQDDGTGKVQVNVTTADTANVSADRTFQVVLYAE